MEAPRIAALMFTAAQSSQGSSFFSVSELLLSALLLLSGIWFFLSNKKHNNQEKGLEHGPILKLERSIENPALPVVSFIRSHVPRTVTHPAPKRLLILTNTGNSTAYNARITAIHWDSTTKNVRYFARIGQSKQVTLGVLKPTDHYVEVVVKFTTSDDQKRETRLQWAEPDQ